MNIQRITPQRVLVRPQKYAREKEGILFAEDNLFYYWIEIKTKDIHRLEKSNKSRLKFRRTYTTSIYIIQNDINNKVYVGKTVGKIKERYNQHLQCIKDLSNTKPLYADMREYGSSHFHIKKIAEVKSCRAEPAMEVENFFITHLNAIIPNGYNRVGNYHSKYPFWYDIYEIILQEEKSHTEDFKTELIDFFGTKNWSKIRDIDLNKINEDIDNRIQKEKIDENIVIDIKRNRYPSRGARRKIAVNYNSLNQDKELLKEKLFNEISKAIDEILNAEIYLSNLNDKTKKKGE